MRHAKALAPGGALFIEVNADDLAGAGKAQALDHVKANAAEAEDDGG